MPKPWTVEDFLEWEAQQPERYEFIDGRIIGMVGGSAAHAAIKDNVTSALNVRLRGGPCRAYSEGLKIVTPAASHYPDVVVTCKSIQPTDDRIGEPVVIVEILSRTTADRDRGAKWVGCQDVASLQHYMLIAQDHRRTDLFSRTGDRWEIRVVRAARRSRRAARARRRVDPRRDLRGQRRLTGAKRRRSVLWSRPQPAMELTDRRPSPGSAA